MSEKVRYDNIDVARGLAMLVIIQWHVVGMHTTMDRWLGNAHLLYHYGRILQAGVFFQGDGYKETQHHCDPNGFFLSSDVYHKHI